MKKLFFYLKVLFNRRRISRQIEKELEEIMEILPPTGSTDHLKFKSYSNLHPKFFEKIFSLDIGKIRILKYNYDNIVIEISNVFTMRKADKNIKTVDVFINKMPLLPPKGTFNYIRVHFPKIGNKLELAYILYWLHEKGYPYEKFFTTIKLLVI